MDLDPRVVALIDMDCFYCQVEEKLDPKLDGQPIAVVQYNAWQGGGIIAVNYPARAQGVTRHMRGNEAKKKCPDIKLVQVPEVRGKADLTKYRDAGKRVSDVLSTFTKLLERASVDEAYLDITETVEKMIEENDLEDVCLENMRNTFVVGAELEDFLVNSKTNRDFSLNDFKLAVGGLLVERIRQEVFIQTGYRCSAGIAHNKILAKLVCGLHKPNQQTILPDRAIQTFFKDMPIRKVNSLGGKFGQSLCDDLNITFMGDLEQFTLNQLAQKYDDKTAKWLYDLARGVQFDPVTSKLLSKSIGTCKNFPGRTALITAEEVQHWIEKLSEEMAERLEKDYEENRRKAKQIIISFTKEIDKNDVQASRTCPLISYAKEKISAIAFDVVKKNCMKNDGSITVKYLGLSAGHFEDVKNIREITSYFTKSSKNPIENTDEKNVFLELTQEIEEDESLITFYDDKYRIKSETNIPNSFFTDYFIPNTSEAATTSDGFATTSDGFATTSDGFATTSDGFGTNVEIENKQQTITCDLCKKEIIATEMQCHQDYHFALSLTESERQEPLTTKTKFSEETKTTKSKSTKRKSSSGCDNKILMSFLVKEDEIDLSTSKKCEECGRNIKEDDISSHMDYHVAKKLHLEMNKVLDKVADNKKKQRPASVLSFYKTC